METKHNNFNKIGEGKMTQNKPIKKTIKWPTKMNISLDKELYEKIKLLSKKEGRSMTKQLLYIVEQYLNFK